MDVAGCPLPDDRLYDLEHEVWWGPPAEDGTASLGLIAPFTAFAGPFHAFAFRPVEGVVAAGRSVATAESARLTGAVRLPIAGEIVARNAALAARPRLLNDDPYGEGWVVRVRPIDPVLPGGPLRTAALVADELAGTIARRRIRCWPRTPDVELSEVGLECSAVLARLNEEVARRSPGECVLLATDDATSPIEMVRWSDQTGYPVLAQRREGTVYLFLVQRVAAPVPRRRG